MSLSYSNRGHNSRYSAGLQFGSRGVRAYYNRNDDHGYLGGRHDLFDRRFNFRNRNRHFGYSTFRNGHYYPYGYSSNFDLYYYRYPYASYGFTPTWSVFTDYPITQTVFVQSPPDIVYIQDNTPPEVVTDVQFETAPSFGNQSATPYDTQNAASYGNQNATPYGNQGVVPPGGTQAALDIDGGTLPDRGQLDRGQRIDVKPQERIPVNNEYLADAHRAFNARDYELARALFAKSVLNDPEDGFAELSYAIGLFATGDYTAAAGALRRGLALAPDVVDMPLDVTRFYTNSSDLEQHRQKLQLFVASNPDDANAWLVLGHIHFSSGEAAEAALAFEKARTLDPSDPFADILASTATRIAYPKK